MDALKEPTQDALKSLQFLRQLPQETYVRTLELQYVEWNHRVEGKRDAERILDRPAYLLNDLLYFDLDIAMGALREYIIEIEGDPNDAQPLNLGEIIFGSFSGYDFGEEYDLFGTFESRYGVEYVIQRGEPIGRLA